MDDRGPWWVVIASAIPGTVSAVWVSWRWLLERSDKRHDGHMSREQALWQQVDAGRASLSTAQMQMFDAVRTENARLATRLREIESDRDHGWDLARWWYDAAQDAAASFRALRHDFADQQQILQSMRSRLPGIPAFAAKPVPGPIILPMGVDDPIKLAIKPTESA